MQVLWDGHDRRAWDEAHRSALAPLQQDWAYGDAMQGLGPRCLRARVEVDGRPLAWAQFMCRRVAALVSVALCSRGPFWAGTPSAQDKARAYRLLARTVPLRRPRVVLFSPDEPLAPAAGVGAMHRVMTGWSTVLVDVDDAPESLRAALNAKWRNRLVAAERSELRVQRNGPKPAQYRWLLERELAQREERAYFALPPGFVEAYQAAKGPGEESVLTLRADLGRDAAAAMMFLVHGASATYHIGWSGDEGRRLGAHNLVLWNALAALRERGVRRLDLGGVNTQRSAGIARFKIGTGGRVVTLAGSFVA